MKLWTAEEPTEGTEEGPQERQEDQKVAPQTQEKTVSKRREQSKDNANVH